MFRSQPHRRRYSGKIILSSQPRNWINKHRSFAFREWFESQVRYGEWVRERNKPNKFLIYVSVLEGIKSLDVLIKITYSPEGTLHFKFDHVAVDHVHVLRKKK